MYGWKRELSETMGVGLLRTFSELMPVECRQKCKIRRWRCERVAHPDDDVSAPGSSAPSDQAGKGRVAEDPDSASDITTRGTR